MKRFFLLFSRSIWAACLLPILTFGQGKHDAIWIFPIDNGIDFNDPANPVPVHSYPVYKKNTGFGGPATSFCDKNGNLLFYLQYNPDSVGSSWGDTDIWRITQNDTQIIPGLRYLAHFGHHPIYILPLNDTVFDIVNYIQLWGYPNTVYRLYRTRLNFNTQADSIEVMLMNDILYTMSGPLGTFYVIRHANGRDWWLVIRYRASNQFTCLRFYDGMIMDTLNFFLSTPDCPVIWHRSSSVNPQGDLLSVVGPGSLKFFDFDRCTGIISNPKVFFQLQDCYAYLPHGGASVAFSHSTFSPNGRVFYFMNGIIPSGTGVIIHQIRLDANRNPVYVGEIGRDTAFNSYLVYTRLAPDGKIYIAPHRGQSTFHPDVSYMATIDYPDSIGTACGYNRFGFSLNGQRADGSLPYYINYRLGPVPMYQLDTPVLYYSIMPGDSVTLGIADTFPEVAYLWQSPQYPGWVSRKMELRVAPPATTTFYYIRTDTAATYSCNQRIDTIVVEVGPCASTTACPVPPICAGDTAWLCASGDGSYLWSPPYNLANAANGGTWAWPETTTVYTVTLTLGNGCTATDSVTVVVNQANVAACPVPPICAGDTAWLCASGDGSYLWSPNYNLANTANGGTWAWPETTTVYTVTLTLGNGCTATDSVTVVVNQANVAACPVPPICAGDTAWLCASGDGSYLWSPPYNLYNAASGGTLAWPETTTVYTVTLTLGNGCTATDSVRVIVHQNSAPTFEDTIIRKGDPFGEFFPTADTTIRYHYLNQYGCDSTVYWEVRIDTLNSIDNGQLIMDNLAVFPNPVRGILYVKHTNQNAAFRLYNKLGQVVIEQQNLPPGTAAVSLSGFAEGVYFWEYALPGTGERVFGKTVKVIDN